MVLFNAKEEGESVLYDGSYTRCRLMKLYVQLEEVTTAVGGATCMNAGVGEIM